MSLMSGLQIVKNQPVLPTVNDTLWLIKGFDVNLPEHKFDWY